LMLDMSEHELKVVDNETGWVKDHIRAYVDSDGADGHTWNGITTLLLTTKGRRSGLWRRTPLIYGEDGDRYLIVASKGGSPTHPAWYLNLVAHPEVHLQVASDKFTATARTATADEKAALWPIMAKKFPTYDDYQRQTTRDIPLVILTRN
jgi:deazaflavin-dependent oxidoreductase (nitroreductase family)